MKCYVNLTGGIECIERLGLKDYRFIRIQSTACEQKRWDFILQDLDYDFLMSLALGERVVVFDTSKRGMSRAVWQGLKWVEYALNRRWFDKEVEVIVRGHNASGYFRQVYGSLDNRTFRKLDYFKKFLNTDQLSLNFTCIKTGRDGDYECFRKILLDRVKKLGFNL
jgi:hypothetical protein